LRVARKINTFSKIAILNVDIRHYMALLEIREQVINWDLKVIPNSTTKVFEKNPHTTFLQCLYHYDPKISKIPYDHLSDIRFNKFFNLSMVDIYLSMTFLGDQQWPQL
jgi:hypothetical protein